MNRIEAEIEALNRELVFLDNLEKEVREEIKRVKYRCRMLVKELSEDGNCKIRH